MAFLKINANKMKIPIPKPNISMIFQLVIRLSKEVQNVSCSIFALIAVQIEV